MKKLLHIVGTCRGKKSRTLKVANAFTTDYAEDSGSTGEDGKLNKLIVYKLIGYGKKGEGNG